MAVQTTTNFAPAMRLQYGKRKRIGEQLPKMRKNPMEKTPRAFAPTARRFY